MYISTELALSSVLLTDCKEPPRDLNSSRCLEHSRNPLHSYKHLPFSSSQVVTLESLEYLYIWQKFGWTLAARHQSLNWDTLDWISSLWYWSISDWVRKGGRAPINCGRGPGLILVTMIMYFRNGLITGSRYTFRLKFASTFGSSSSPTDIEVTCRRLRF